MPGLVDMPGVQLVAGLGNPGDKYLGTRHNAGFALVDALVAAFAGRFEPSRIHGGECWTGRFRGGSLALLKPMTFMNLSGQCVAGVCRDRKVVPAGLLLVHDDMDIALGRLRFRRGGGSAGHNGVQSVIDELGSDGFARLRVGIGREAAKGAMVDHVLSEFEGGEKELFARVIDICAAAVKLCLSRGVEAAMNQYNGLDLAAPPPAAAAEGPVD